MPDAVPSDDFSPSPVPAAAPATEGSNPAVSVPTATGNPIDNTAGAGAGGDDFNFSEADLTSADEGSASNGVVGDDVENPAAPNGEARQQGEYTLTFAEDSPVPEFVRGDLTRVAQELEVPADKASALYERGLTAFRTLANKQLREEGVRLKEEWGERYAANVQAVKPLMVRVLKKAGIPLENAGPLKSPMGFRLMNAVREMMGESSNYAGKATADVTLSREQQIQAIYNDPKKMAILSDPGNPQWAELNAHLNHLLGLP